MEEQAAGVSPGQLAKLAECFPADDIEWRVGMSKLDINDPWVVVLAYITNRAIMDRLDTVCGPANWRNEYQKTPNDPSGNSCVCGISIRINGEWVTKWDGADNSKTEPIKGGLSDAMKRAAVQWGIGRYLYDLKTNYANVSTQKVQGGRRLYDKQNSKTVYWTPPALPAWALPGNTPEPKTTATPKTNGKQPESREELLGKLEATLRKMAIDDTDRDALVCYVLQKSGGTYQQVIEADTEAIRMFGKELYQVWAEFSGGGTYKRNDLLQAIREPNLKVGK